MIIERYTEYLCYVPRDAVRIEPKMKNCDVHTPILTVEQWLLQRLSNKVSLASEEKLLLPARSKERVPLDGSGSLISRVGVVSLSQQITLTKSKLP